MKGVGERLVPPSIISAGEQPPDACVKSDASHAKAAGNATLCRSSATLGRAENMAFERLSRPIRPRAGRRSLTPIAAMQSRTRQKRRESPHSKGFAKLDARPQAARSRPVGRRLPAGPGRMANCKLQISDLKTAPFAVAGKCAEEAERVNHGWHGWTMMGGSVGGGGWRCEGRGPRGEG